MRSENQRKIVLALGYFDSVHVGHRKIISAAVEHAKKQNLRCYVYTFSNDVYSFFGDNSGQVFTFKERCKKFNQLGIDKIIAFEFDENLKNTDKNKFLFDLKNSYNVEKIFCGYDYTFGKNGEGNVQDLREFFGEENVCVFSKIEYDKKRVSTTEIKKLLKDGNIERANALLGAPYSICGKIEKGRGEGHIYGFPTANIEAQKDKFLPKEGVYVTKTVVGNKCYRSVTNVGAKPTFNDFSFTIESFLADFDGDLYGKEVVLEFYSYLRETKRFLSPDELKNQIYSDMKKSEGLC